MTKMLKRRGSETTKSDPNRKLQYRRERFVRPASSAQMMKMPTISSFKVVKLRRTKVTTTLMVSLRSKGRRAATTRRLWSTGSTVGPGTHRKKVALGTPISGSTSPHYLVPLYQLVLRGEG